VVVIYLFDTARGDLVANPLCPQAGCSSGLPIT